MKIGYIVNAPLETGIGHRAACIRRELQKQAELEICDITFDTSNLPFRPWPGVLGNKSMNWMRWGRRIDVVADVFDVTNQTLSFVAKRLTPTVVTVHDIIEVIEPQDSRAALLNKYLYSGISKASHIIAVSEYTKKTIMDYYRLPAARISVIPNGVAAEFYPIDDFKHSIGFQEICRELRLGDAHPIVLYVGSDHPRKNVPVALEVFARLQQKRPDAVFLKVGEPGIPAGRTETLEAIDRLGIKQSVRFVGRVSNERLNLLYNLANVFLYPSRFEGFGLPPLQAMAAGLPVVTSNATSIPEVVGDAAATHDADDIDSMVTSVEKMSSDRKTAAEYRRRGLGRARTFTWEKTAQQVAQVYKKIAN